ncbi:5-formyltetrahydrofolate cyclo-ligase [Clostridiales bacterium PH28_bin88]|nr:5-formyltetrahydrofolate cyclo-ligase [Clostridiales bacterium PH28_bin88]
MKNSVRRQIIQSRLDLSQEEVTTKSAAIARRVFSLPAWEEAEVVMAYIDFRHEVETAGVIARALEEGKRVAIPVCKKDPLRLIPSELKEYPGDLAPGTWGILEPKEGRFRPLDPQEIDLVLVPGVAFDEMGNRLGYGAGYYDRFLQTLRPDAVTAALAYELQVREDVFPEAHDQPVQMVITEQRVIDCAANRESGKNN